MFLLFSFYVFATAAQTKKEAYIAKYSSIAIDEMNRYNIPASITLAQAILESGAGESRLATEGNNHFGIKCHDNWSGEIIIEDDDAKGECFRKYSKSTDSYRDHSLFLTERGRYSFLFEYGNTDYKKWAKGLKRAGYATNPEYPTLLINLIEKYDLGRFDNPSSQKKSLYFAHSYGLPYLTGLGTYYFKTRSMYSTEVNTSFIFSEANIGYHYTFANKFYGGINSGVLFVPIDEPRITPYLSSELMYKIETQRTLLVRVGIQIPFSEIHLFYESFNAIPYFRLIYLLH
ncbi:MAG: glucosaminidase domain-containing protein [Bacteroidota bacterium]|nr:glucosaminidase domain-containing protein [Bacteroidota bacterium]